LNGILAADSLGFLKTGSAGLGRKGDLSHTESTEITETKYFN